VRELIHFRKTLDSNNFIAILSITFGLFESEAIDSQIRMYHTTKIKISESLDRKI